jgi:hypothetical protein
MRLLNVVVGRLRSVRISEVENVRSVLEIRRGDAVADTQSVRTNADAVIRAGGRVVKAEVVPGTGETITLARLLEIWEGDTPPPDMVARHNAILAEFGITREQAATIEVLSGFDIVIELLPEAAVPPVDPGALPVPVLPGGGGGHHDDDD